jgi:hypothetical protein
VESILLIPSGYALFLSERKTLEFESEQGFQVDRVEHRCRVGLYFDLLAIHMVHGYPKTPGIRRNSLEAAAA